MKKYKIGEVERVTSGGRRDVLGREVRGGLSEMLTFVQRPE